MPVIKPRAAGAMQAHQQSIFTIGLRPSVLNFWLNFFNRWRAGQTVNDDEQLNLAEMEESMTASTVSNVPPVFDRSTAGLHLPSSHISLEDQKNLEEERQKLFKLLDVKDDEIQVLSERAKKLEEQMLVQEELILSTQRDYENLTMEMNKIQVCP